MGVGLGVVSAAPISKGPHDPRLVRGAMAGALLGGVAGYALHQFIDQRESRARRETLFNLESYGLSPSSSSVDVNKWSGANGIDGISSSDLEKMRAFINSPKVREDYVETHTTEDGKKLIEGHRVWTLIGYPQFNLVPPKSFPKNSSKSSSKRFPTGFSKKQPRRSHKMGAGSRGSRHGTGLKNLGPMNPTIMKTKEVK